MATMTIEYNARNKTTRQVIDGLVSTGVFNVINKSVVNLNLPRTSMEMKKSVMAGMNDYRNKRIISHEEIEKETALW